MEEHQQEGILIPGPHQSFDTYDRFSLIAIMLGRLEMDVESCITAYTNLMNDIFGKRAKPINWKLDVKGQFSANALEKAIKSLIPVGDDPEGALLNKGRPDIRCHA